MSFRTLLDSAFSVPNGAVRKVKWLEEGGNVGWRITDRPDGSSDVAVALPITTGCDYAGAICAEEGRMLRNRNEVTVSGPDG